MIWIRSPTWDLGWVWSGPLLGLLLLALPMNWRLDFLAVGACAQMAHHVSPIAMAWSHKGYRETMLRQWPKFVGLPAAIVLVAIGIGTLTAFGHTSYDLRAPFQLRRITNFSNPLPLMAWSAMVFNVYHFGSQWYGLVRLYLRKRELSSRAQADLKTLCVATAFILILVLPIIAPLPAWFMLWMFGAVSLQHWLSDLGLSERGARKLWWTALMLGVAPLALIITEGVDINTGQIVVRGGGSLWLIIYTATVGLTAVHILYSRWAWRLDAPFIKMLLADTPR